MSRISFREAYFTGARHYHGRRCKKHPEIDGQRWTHSSKCVRCSTEARAKWKRDEPEKAGARARAWHQRTLEQETAARRIRSARRRVRERMAGDGLAISQRREIRFLRAFANLWGMTVDHVVPLAGCRVCGARGLHEPDNMALLSSYENTSKGDRCLACWSE